MRISRLQLQGMVMFKVKDTVIHPKYGICKITAMRDDKQGRAYVLKPKRYIPGNFKVLIHEKKIENSGVRHPIKKSKISDILRILGGEPNNISEDCKNGYPLTRERILSNNLYRITEAVRDIEKQNRHSLVKEDLLQSARQTLVEEIAYVKRLPKDKVDRLIGSTLKSNIS